MSIALASVSIDLDDVPRYASIHGVRTPRGSAAHAVYDRCVPRLTEWLHAESIRATFFAIGEDLARDENRKTISGLHAGGHEIANHSHRHLYDLTQRPAQEIYEEVEQGAAAIEAACGERPVGFRAPGYTVSDELFEALGAAGAHYDSSVFPCLTYYAAKGAALASIKLRGGRSASRMDRPAVLRAPREPYRVGRPYWRRGDGMLELPVGVTPWQLPYIGTSLVLGGDRMATLLSKQMLGRELINLELHGFDVADAAEDGLELLAPHRADLKRSAEAKLDALRAALRVIRNAGYEFVTLAEAARRFSARPNP